MKYFKKKAKESELLALNILEELNIIQDVYPHYLISNNNLFVEKCEQKNTFSVDLFLETIDFCIKNVYIYKFNFFTTGIYAFIPSNHQYFSKSNYLENLKQELIALTKTLSIDDELSNIIKKIMLRLNKYEYHNDNQLLSLLHGDLHPGNIVLKDGQVFLIDWEYLSVGLPEVEIAYFLLLFVIDNDYDKTLQEKSLWEIEKRALEWKINFVLLKEFFVPYICLCLLLCTKNDLIQNNLFSQNKIKGLLETFDL